MVTQNRDAGTAGRYPHQLSGLQRRSCSADALPVTAGGDGLNFVFMAANATAKRTSAGFGETPNVKVGARLPRSAGVGVVVTLCSCEADAAALAVTRAVVESVPFRGAEFAAALVDRGSGARLVAAAAYDTAFNHVALTAAPLDDGA